MWVMKEECMYIIIILGSQDPSTAYPQIRRFSYFNPGPLLPLPPREKRDAIASSFAIERNLADAVCLLRNAIRGL